MASDSIDCHDDGGLGACARSFRIAVLPYAFDQSRLPRLHGFDGFTGHHARVGSWFFAGPCLTSEDTRVLLLVSRCHHAGSLDSHQFLGRPAGHY